MIGQETHSPEQLLALLQAAIRDAPDFGLGQQLMEKDIRWLGRVDAILDASDLHSALVDFRIARRTLGKIPHSRNDILIPLYDALSHMELLVPPSLQGAFIPAGDTWNGYAALIKILQSKCDDILIVDPYIDSGIYLDFAPLSKARNGIRCLTAKRNTNHSGLLASAAKWQSDAISESQTVEIRYASATELHDRLIITDSTEVWLVSQSIKDIAKRSPASVTKAEADLGQMKTLHYNMIWEQSAPLV